MKLFKKCEQKKLNPAIYVAVLVPILSSSQHSNHDGLSGLSIGLIFGLMIVSLVAVKICKKKDKK